MSSALLIDLLLLVSPREALLIQLQVCLMALLWHQLKWATVGEVHWKEGSGAVQMSEVFSGKKGKFVEIEQSVEGFKALLEGEGDDYPENAFYMTGTLEEAIEEGKRLAMQAEGKS